MYPCFDASVTYGLAVTGLNVTGSLPVSLATDGAVSEPDVRTGAAPAALHGAVTVSGLKAGGAYALYRFNTTAALPASPPFAPTADTVTPFTAAGPTWTYADPKTFPSNTAVYYLAAAA